MVGRKNFVLKDPPSSFAKQKKRASSKPKKRTKLEVLPEDEDYEEEDEISSPSPNRKESTMINTASTGVRIPMQNFNKQKDNSQKSSPVNRNGPAKGMTISNSPFSKGSPDKSATAANVNLYGGNIYLLGGNHVMAGN